MTPRTAEALEEIRRAVRENHKRIAPALYSHFHGRAATAAAFRMAKAQGIIEVAYTSLAGTPVYQPAGLNAAIAEAATAVKH